MTRPSALPAARRAVEAELAAVDRSCSRFREDSELSRLNARCGRFVPVGPLLLEALTVALRAAVLTQGRVDPTIGEALVVAGYDRDFATLPGGRRPVVKATRVPGWRTVSLDPRRRRAMVPRGVRLDLGATAKALAADRAARAAARPGVGVLVNLGGDIAVAGPPPPGGWGVRVVDDHRASSEAPGQTVLIQSGGLATSSTTVRTWARGAHHIIDPETGAPAAGRWRTVSVAAASCVDANIASTAAIVRGESAVAWLDEQGMPARLVDRRSRIVTTGPWPRDAARA